ncbi:helicase-related protein [Desulforhopalus sp. 52FAK]
MLDKKEYQQTRTQLLGWVKKQLTGFDLEDDRLVGVPPLDRFFSGILFPLQQAGELGADDSCEEEQGSQPVRKNLKYTPPSSAGFSFYVTGKEVALRVNCQAVCYEKEEKGRDEQGRFVTGEDQWKRGYLANKDGEEKQFLPDGDSEYTVLGGKARLCTLWRPHEDGYIVTVSLSNQQRSDEQIPQVEKYIDLNQKSLFETALTCFVEKGEVANYPSVDRALLTEEEKELELRYKDVRILAVGHGTGVDWFVDKRGITVILADFMPSVEVPQVTANTGDAGSNILKFEYLCSCDENSDVVEDLKSFVAGYKSWIHKQSSDARTEIEEDQQAANKIVNNQIIAKERMEAGILLLKYDANARFAFSLANKAMVMQMQAVEMAKSGKPVESSKFGWRPFQLAFILMTLASAVDGDDDYRDIVDLIWFPTGGGKTEAYLGLLAFLMIYRRKRYPSSHGGTVAIMRYTLRLLTAQQFTRATKVICALELLRQNDPAMLGSERFSIGLWVGQASSPNTCKQAFDYLNKNQLSKFIITSCPWCGARFTKENYAVDEDSFYYKCFNKKCDFGCKGDSTLPCNTVDHMLYKNPPSLLIATVDKFSLLTWDERPAAFFGSKGNRPPELIIQDELHLIASELGSVVGLYELGIDVLLEKKGVRPKYVASTATVKNAETQIQALYGREMQVFPPSGLRYDDSYFAKTVPLSVKPGRMYIGFLANFPSRLRCLSPLTATLLAAPVHLFRDRELFMDSWWSQVIYHGSLKGVGNSRTLYQSSVLKYLNRLILEGMRISIEEVRPGILGDKKIRDIEDYQKINDPEIKQIVDQYLPVRNLLVKTLTSRQTAEENNRVFDQLTKEYNENSAIDILLATNMISVGLDVARLAVMIINGQPLTTSEYIQASSRVGRSDTPGLVFVNYYKTQARSLSHYENFRSYHESFYRFVEPSSLTPFTYQARERALHAALVIAMRHGIASLTAKDGAENFSKDMEEVQEVIDLMERRIKDAILPFDQDTVSEEEYTELLENVNQVLEHLHRRVDEWDQEAEDVKNRRGNLNYCRDSNDRSAEGLMVDFTDRTDVRKWKTLRSMRNVENSALLRLVGGVTQPS